jgi:uncharacterized protein YeaO (DUF488 family)
MNVTLRHYSGPEDFERVGEFLVDNYQPGNQDGNWLQLESLADDNDLVKIDRVVWRGFNHEGEPPRGVPKAEHASRDFYDVWLPELAPSERLVREGLHASDERAWLRFAKRYRAEMKRPEAARLLVLFAAPSHQTNISVGCYCADEARCHRSVLKALLLERGAILA